MIVRGRRLAAHQGRLRPWLRGQPDSAARPGADAGSPAGADPRDARAGCSQAYVAAGVAPLPGGYGLVLGEDGDGARWTAVIADMHPAEGATGFVRHDRPDHQCRPVTGTIVAVLPCWPAPDPAMPVGSLCAVLACHADGGMLGMLSVITATPDGQPGHGWLIAPAPGR